MTHIPINMYRKLEDIITKDDTQNVKNQLNVSLKSNTIQPNFNFITQTLVYIKIFFEQKVVNRFIEI